MNLEVYGWALLGVVRSINILWGRGTFSALLDGLSDANRKTVENKLHASSLYSGTLASELLSALEKTKGDGRGGASYDTGYETGKLAIENVFPIYRSITEEARFVRSMPRLWERMMNHAGKIELPRVEDNHAVLSVAGYPLPEKFWPRFWAGWVHGAMEAACNSEDLHVDVGQSSICEAGLAQFDLAISWTTILNDQ